ncbi:MAG: hypothetical protein JJE02_00890 [Propionibacteriales bacterium]|nr:hypothetical protein [Propionibacteriales bacterium]
MRTTVNIDEQLLAETKLIAARTHRTIGSVLEDALRKLINEQTSRASNESYTLPDYSRGSLRPGVDLENKDQIEELLDDGKFHVLP